jgi:hypothetical protein
VIDIATTLSEAKEVIKEINERITWKQITDIKTLSKH